MAIKTVAGAAARTPAQSPRVSAGTKKRARGAAAVEIPPPLLDGPSAFLVNSGGDEGREIAEMRDVVFGPRGHQHREVSHG